MSGVMYKFSGLVAIGALILASGPGVAGVHKCKDASGSTYFSDKPCGKGEKPAIEQAPAVPVERPVPRQPKVKQEIPPPAEPSEQSPEVKEVLEVERAIEEARTMRKMEAMKQEQPAVVDPVRPPRDAQEAGELREIEKAIGEARAAKQVEEPAASVEEMPRQPAEATAPANSEEVVIEVINPVKTSPAPEAGEALNQPVVKPAE